MNVTKYSGDKMFFLKSISNTEKAIKNKVNPILNFLSSIAKDLLFYNNYNIRKNRQEIIE